MRILFAALVILLVVRFGTVGSARNYDITERRNAIVAAKNMSDGEAGQFDLCLGLASDRDFSRFLTIYRRGEKMRVSVDRYDGCACLATKTYGIIGTSDEALIRAGLFLALTRTRGENGVRRVAERFDASWGQLRRYSFLYRNARTACQKPSLYFTEAELRALN
ncbi:MAG: hypothetical protein AAFR23_08605 [Pseudomonadota bacterium]